MMKRISLKADTERGSRIPTAIALAGCLVIGGQIVSILLQGKTVCLNQGCQVLEGLTRIPPLYFNLLGLGYFLTLAVVLAIAAKRGKAGAFLPSLLLLAGMGVEGALVSYQQFAVRTFCSYCLTVAGLILLLNLLQGWRHLVRAGLVFGGVVLAMSMLDFGSAMLLSRAETLQAGVYAVRPGKISGNRYHLIISATCPHCQNVLDALDRYPDCTVAINPISAKPPETATMNLQKKRGYLPEVNRLLLALLDIKEIPVMLEYSENGETLYKGEKDILRVLDRECATPVSPPRTDTYGRSTDGMSTQEPPQDAGECTIEESCESR